MDILQLQRSKPDGLRQSFLTLISTCEEMIHLAGKGDWQRVAELEARRSRELREHFSGPMDAASSAETREAIETIAALNDRLVRLATQARDDVAGKLSQVHQGSKASRAYLSAGRGG